jgi:hypothetical protein
MLNSAPATNTTSNGTEAYVTCPLNRKRTSPAALERKALILGGTRDRARAGYLRGRAKAEGGGIRLFEQPGGAEVWLMPIAGTPPESDLWMCVKRREGRPVIVLLSPPGADRRSHIRETSWCAHSGRRPASDDSKSAGQVTCIEVLARDRQDVACRDRAVTVPAAGHAGLPIPQRRSRR